MNHLFKKCPVCDKVLDGSEVFCPQCAFDLRIIPQNAPDSVKEQERMRIETARNAYIRISAVSEELNKNASELKHRISELEAQNTGLSKQIADVTTAKEAEVSRLKKENESISKELALSKSKKQESIEQVKSKDSVIDRLKKEADTKDGTIKDNQKTITQLKQDIRRLEDQIKKVTSAPKIEKEKTVGYLIAQQDDELINIYPVFAGKNVYGCAPKQKPGIMVHQISVVSPGLQPEHFSITADDEGESIKAVLMSGNWSINNPSNHPSSVELEYSDIILIQNLRLMFFQK